MSVRQLADFVGLHDIEIEEAENGSAVSKGLLYKLSDRLDVLPDMLIPPNVAT
jgi:hypothetical protein